MARLGNKAATVTGGALGIGAATSAMLAREGAAVAVTDLRDQEGEAVAAQIREEGGNARYWHLDVTDEAEVTRVFEEGVDAFRKLDVLVNNAGFAGVNQPTDEIAVHTAQ